MQTMKYRVSGLVQGVGFRYSTQVFAQKIGLKGSVKNENDGTVTIIAQGDAATLSKFIHQLPSHLSPFAKIEHVNVESLDNYPQLADFRVLY
ncbi:MAG: acylphosphatase [Lactobacillus sp.]|nr:acylphosphatase [Lactobacillus sp.]